MGVRSSQRSEVERVGLGRAEWLLPAGTQSVSRARTLIADRLRDFPEESTQVAVLLTSELMTNAVLHGTGPVGLNLGWDEDSVRVEVTDQSPDRPAVQSPDQEALNGRGLLLVDGLSSAWGVLTGEPGKTVWFTLHT